MSREVQKVGAEGSDSSPKEQADERVPTLVDKRIEYEDEREKENDRFDVSWLDGGTLCNCKVSR